MVEGDVFPATGSMTTRAIGPKLTVMCIVCSMAGKTTRRRTRLDVGLLAVRVALLR